jgi:hypothetical protein
VSRAKHGCQVLRSRSGVLRLHCKDNHKLLVLFAHQGKRRRGEHQASLVTFGGDFGQLHRIRVDKAQLVERRLLRRFKKSAGDGGRHGTAADKANDPTAHDVPESDFDLYHYWQYQLNTCESREKWEAAGKFDKK